MKSLLIALTLVLASTSIVATAGQLERCATLSRIAEGIMETRQSGNVSHSAMVDRTRSLNIGASIERSTLAVIGKAYAEPRFNTEEYQKKAAIDFGNDAYRSCLKVISRK